MRSAICCCWREICTSWASSSLAFPTNRSRSWAGHRCHSRFVQWRSQIRAATIHLVHHWRARRSAAATGCEDLDSRAATIGRHLVSPYQLNDFYFSFGKRSRFVQPDHAGAIQPLQDIATFDHDLAFRRRVPRRPRSPAVLPTPVRRGRPQLTGQRTDQLPALDRETAIQPKSNRQVRITAIDKIATDAIGPLNNFGFIKRSLFHQVDNSAQPRIATRGSCFDQKYRSLVLGAGQDLVTRPSCDCGCDSPVRIDSSISLLPSMITASTGIKSPGRISSRSSVWTKSTNVSTGPSGDDFASRFRRQPIEHFDGVGRTVLLTELNPATDQQQEDQHR